MGIGKQSVTDLLPVRRIDGVERKVVSVDVGIILTVCLSQHFPFKQVVIKIVGCHEYAIVAIHCGIIERQIIRALRCSAGINIVQRDSHIALCLLRTELRCMEGVVDLRDVPHGNGERE